MKRYVKTIFIFSAILTVTLCFGLQGPAKAAGKPDFIHTAVVGDFSENTKPATPAGNDFRYEPVEARYVRVNMLYHNLNKGVHLVEVRVFESDGSSE